MGLGLGSTRRLRRLCGRLVRLVGMSEARACTHMTSGVGERVPSKVPVSPPKATRAHFRGRGQVRPLSDYTYRCWTCKTLLRMVSSTLGVCPQCSLEPVRDVW
jgi:hypothetical protein